MIKIPIEVITLEDDSYHLLVACRINDSQNFLVIDTGASKTVLDANFVTDYTVAADEQKIKSQGVGDEQFVTQMVEVDKIEIGLAVNKLEDEDYQSFADCKESVEINHFKCALIDLSALNTMYKRYCNRTICGLLGSDFLLKYAAIIDYQRKTLLLQPKLQSNEN